ncbi:MAG: hypothetical protein Fur006_11950 [Coleofasciculaceae cyanobacterium]
MSVNAIALGIGRFNIEVKTIEVVVIKGKRINSLSHTESVRLEYYVFLTQRGAEVFAEERGVFRVDLGVDFSFS